MNELMRGWISKEVLTTQEVAAILGISRQHVTNLVSRNKLVPFKSVPGCNLFLLEDIETYRAKKSLSQITVPREIYGDGITRKAKAAFERIVDIERVVSVYVYFYDFDAIEDTFFTTSKIAKRDTLMGLETPTFVVKYDNLDEVWFTGLNAGYGGQGPTGSYEVLRSLDVPEDIAKKVFTCRWVKYFRDGEEWNCISKDRYDQDEREAELRELDGESRRCVYNGNLVLLHDSKKYSWLDVEPLGFVKRHLSFIPNPQNVFIFSKAMALQEGRYVCSSVREQYYCVCIQDRSKRELWLSIPIDEKKSIGKQVVLKELFELLGVKISLVDSVTDGIKKLFGETVSVYEYGIGR